MNQTPNAKDLLKARIAALAPLIAEHREAMESQRRLPRALFEAIADAGLLRLWSPRKLGGWELSLPDFMEVVEAAAGLDGSVGWIVANGGGMSRAGGYLPERIGRELFADPRTFIVATTGAVGEAVPVEGGYRISGRWPFASGIHHANIVAPACRVSAGSREGAVLMGYVPARHAEVVDTWFVSGLRGSGSCDYSLKDVFVPESHVHDMLSPPAIQPGPIYKLPSVSAFVTTVAVVPLGIARAALDYFTGSLCATARAGTSTALRDRELIQSEVGRAATMLAAGRALLVASMSELSDAIEAGGERLLRARAAYRAACAHAAESAVRVVDIVSTAAGAVSIWEAHPLERQVRDIDAAVKHIAMSPNNYVVAGRVALGLDAGTPRF